MSTLRKNQERVRDVGMASGTQTHLSGLGSLTVNGTSYPVPAIVQRLNARIALLDAITAAQVVLDKAVAEAKADRTGFIRFFGGLRSIVYGMYGTDVKVLADFAMSPRKQGKPTLKTKADGVTKAQATRKARHTMGPRQRARIKGTTAETAPQPAPQTAPQAPAPTAPAAAPVIPAGTNGTAAHGSATGSGS